jgi:hypothetical protein
MRWIWRATSSASTDWPAIRQIEAFEDWAADIEVPIVVINASGAIYTNPETGNGPIISIEMLELMEHWYKIPIGLHENVYCRARQEGIRRRIAQRRECMKSVRELKAGAEW